MHSKILCTLLCAFVATTALAKPTKKSDPVFLEEYPADTTRLPPNYKGVDFKAFLALIKKAEASLVKDPYETTADFEARKANADHLIRPLSMGKMYAFSVSGLGAKYSADAQAYHFGHAYHCSVYLSSDHVMCRIGELSVTQSKYIGQTTFGATFPVKEIRSERFGLAVPTSSRFITDNFSRNSPYFSRKLEMPVERARGLRNDQIATLLVGKIERIGTERADINTSSPTFSDPVDYSSVTVGVPFVVRKLVVYVVSTGEILDQVDY